MKDGRRDRIDGWTDKCMDGYIEDGWIDTWMGT